MVAKVAEQAGRRKGRRVVASVSGGKDSAAMSLVLTEAGVEHDRVFCDTGWEHRETYDYIRGELARVVGPVTEIRPPRDFVDLVRHKGMFPSRLRRWCTQELKVKVMRRHLEEIGGPIVNSVGIRGRESEARAQLFEWEPEPDMGKDVLTWRPLISWTVDDVIAMHKRHGLLPNPLYLQGAERVGCWPCIFSRKAELRHVADTDPDTIDRIRELEAEAADTARARAKAKGEVPMQPPTMFQQSARNGDGKRPCIPIDEVVKWARTGRNGRQFELFAEPRESGCFRWGLCDQAPE